MCAVFETISVAKNATGKIAERAIITRSQARDHRGSRGWTPWLGAEASELAKRAEAAESILKSENEEIRQLAELNAKRRAVKVNLIIGNYEAQKPYAYR